MKKFGKLLLAAMFAVAIAGGGPSLASQASLVMPTVGPLSGLSFLNLNNAAFDALATCNSGATQPLNAATAPSSGQVWCDNSVAGAIAVKQYDGSNWVILGVIDTTTHIWTPPVGGGAATLASGSTVDLGSVPQAAVDITGTTTITSFGSSAVVGSIHFLRFTGALTLTHNAMSLILPANGNNIPTAAGDTAAARYLGAGNWLVLWYTNANGTALQSQNVTSASLLPSAQGMNAALNLRLNASASGSALTVSIKTAANADASPTSPILIPFRDPTSANGDPVIGSLQSALSFTVASTMTLGTQSGNVPFRFWVIAYYNGGTLAVGLFNASSFTSTGGTIYPLADGGVVSTAASTNGGNSAGTHYANVSTITNTPFRILGYLEWASGIATAGTWNSGPTSIVLFGPGIKKPGDVVQMVYSSTTTPTTVSGASKVATALVGSITPTSAVNPIKVQAYGEANSPSTSSSAFISQIWRNAGTTAIGNLTAAALADGIGKAFPTANVAIDNPATTSATQYGLYITDVSGSNATTFLGTSLSIPTNTGVMIIEEIMGALDEPANDNGSSEQRMAG